MRGLLKHSIVIYQSAYWLLGLATFVLSVYLYTESSARFDGGTIANPYQASAAVLMFNGLIMCALALVGFYMTCLERQPFIEVTLVCSCLMSLTVVASTYLTRPSPGQVESRNQLNMMDIIWNHYGVGPIDEPERAVDHVQRTFHCCGFDSYSNWKFSKFSKFQEATYKRHWGTGILRLLDASSVIPEHLLPEFYHIPMSCCRETKQDFDCIRYFAIGRKASRSVASETAESGHNIHLDGCSGQMADYVRQMNEILQWVIYVSLGSVIFPIVFLAALLLANELGARTVQSGVAGTVISVGGIGLPHVFRPGHHQVTNGIIMPNIVIDRY